MKQSIDLRDFRHYAFLSTKEETTAKLHVDKANQESPESKTIAVMTLGGTYHLYQRRNEPEMVEAVMEEPFQYQQDAKEWERIAEQRMKEINRLRQVISAGKGHDATFIEEVGTEQTGGGVMVDFVNFKRLPYVIGITDSSVVVYKSRASFCGDESEVLGSISLEEPIPDYKKIDAIDKMMADLEKLRHSFFRLKTTWEKIEENYDMDLNEKLQFKYPFKESFDELSFMVQDWETECDKTLLAIKRELIYGPKLANRNNLGEPPAPYFTKAEAEGKWICAFDTICEGYQCVTTENEKGETIPYLYDSKAEVEADDFFDHQEDFAILATEFVLGRKVIFGKNGGSIEGTPIVKPE